MIDGWEAEFEEAQRDLGADGSPGEVWGLENIAEPDEVIFAGSVEIARAFRGKVASGGDGCPQVIAIEPPKRGGVQAMLKALNSPRAADALRPVRKFQIAFGDTPAERQAADELARRLGRHRCWQVKIPKPRTQAALADALVNSEPYPLEGVWIPQPGFLMEASQRHPIPTITTGCIGTDQTLSLPTEGRLITVTGVPQSGKSLWLTHLVAHTALKHGRKWAIFSPEMDPVTDLAEQVGQAIIGKNIRYSHHLTNRAAATDEDKVKAEWFMRERFAFMEHSDDADEEISDNRAPTLSWFLDTVKDLVLRRGVTDAILDPYNEIEVEQPAGTSEVQWLGKCLRRINRFAKRYGCNIYVAAHPTKMQPAKRGDPTPMPGIYDISGGAMWANKSAMMLCVHRVSEVTEIHNLKVKFPRWGKRNDFARIKYDQWNSRYHDVAPEEMF